VEEPAALAVNAGITAVDTADAAEFTAMLLWFYPSRRL
jgi:hypothetical protein